MATTPNTSTCETCPRHIWIHEVELAAIAKGADAYRVRELRAEMHRWYVAGEPVWMAAESAAFVAKERAKEAARRTK